MKKTKLYLILMAILIISFNPFETSFQAYSQQSIFNIGTGTTCEVQAGVDICVDTIMVFGTFIMNGTYCGLSLPAPPVLVSPVNGATLVATNPLLDWNSSATAVSYRVQVSTDSGITGTVYDSSNITITEFQIPNNGLTINTTYYWRVNATNIAGTSPYSIIFHFTTGATNISGNNEIPKEFILYNNYPNPFNPVTNIKFDLPKQTNTILILYDIIGREVTRLVNTYLPAGSYTVAFNASHLSSGIYFYKIITNEFIDVKEMIILK
ncbi:T9SS type A sorting domain-containing protein [Bacteroidota bacterium]